MADYRHKKGSQVPTKKGSGHGYVTIRLPLQHEREDECPVGPVSTADHTIVGFFDLRDIKESSYLRMLDYFAASPGAFRLVRAFHCLTDCWPKGQPMDFYKTVELFKELVKRHLVPYVVLGFFPTEISDSEFSANLGDQSVRAKWVEFVRAFVEALFQEFGDRVSSWLFEVWNEPDKPFGKVGPYSGFFSGTMQDYETLYLATSDAVKLVGLPIRLGGPAMMWASTGSQGIDSSPDERMTKFLKFCQKSSAKIDFISFHRKGSFGSSGISLDWLKQAIISTSTTAKTFGFAGLPIVNPEADEQAGFDNPLVDRVNCFMPAWLTAVFVFHDYYSSPLLFGNHAGDESIESSVSGFKFLAGSDDANLALVKAPFDGRRSILTSTSNGESLDLIKVPGYQFYELARWLGPEHAAIGNFHHFYPKTNLFAVASVNSGTRLSVLMCKLDESIAKAKTGPKSLTLHFHVPYSVANIAAFRLSDKQGHSSYSAFKKDKTNFTAVRDFQELLNFGFAPAVLSGEMGFKMPVKGGVISDSTTIDVDETVFYHVSPYEVPIKKGGLGADPVRPDWLIAQVEGGNVLLRWAPTTQVDFLMYQVYITDRGGWVALLPETVVLRSALWVHTGASKKFPGERRYAVSLVNVSAFSSDIAESNVIFL